MKKILTALMASAVVIGATAIGIAPSKADSVNWGGSVAPQASVNWGAPQPDSVNWGFRSNNNQASVNWGAPQPDSVNWG